MRLKIYKTAPSNVEPRFLELSMPDDDGLRRATLHHIALRIADRLRSVSGRFGELAHWSIDRFPGIRKWLNPGARGDGISLPTARSVGRLDKHHNVFSQVDWQEAASDAAKEYVKAVALTRAEKHADETRAWIARYGSGGGGSGGGGSGGGGGGGNGGGEGGEGGEGPEPKKKRARKRRANTREDR